MVSGVHSWDYMGVVCLPSDVGLGDVMSVAILYDNRDDAVVFLDVRIKTALGLI